MRAAHWFTLFRLVTAWTRAEPAPVTLTRLDDRVALTNGLVTAELGLRTGKLLSFRLGARELLSEPAYLDWQDGKQNHPSAATLEVRADPASTPDGRAEIALAQAWSRDAQASALDVALHYTLLPGERALRMFAVFCHPADYPAAGFGQSRYVLRVRDDVFETISVDEARTHRLPAGDTPDEVLGPKESMRFTAGPYAGKITDKYHYFTDSGGHFFHGWMGSDSRLGLWLVYGSTEDQNGGPTRQHNTAHWPRMLLKILSCGHYGAPGVGVAAGEAWEKIYRPWMLYANEAAAPANATDRQQQSLGYQTWTRADADGRFTLPAVRPGRYTLHAFADGVLDELVRADIEVAAGASLDLGELAWTPVSRGRQLWKIGVPDRTAREFRHGEDHRRWGLWRDYEKDFPRDVNFVVGQSEPRYDLNFAQATRLGPDGHTYLGTTWRVVFLIDETPGEGDAVLRFAFAAAHNASLRVHLDDQPIGDLPRLGSDNALARAGIHGQYSTWDMVFPAALLTPGKHTLTLEQRAGGAAFKNVMYDCIRLEVP